LVESVGQRDEDGCLLVEGVGWRDEDGCLLVESLGQRNDAVPQRNDAVLQRNDAVLLLDEGGDRLAGVLRPGRVARRGKKVGRGKYRDEFPDISP
jgi:hypothetical protein